MLRIYLGRHGQTDWNALQRLQGWTDIPLNETGRSQALELRENLRGIPFDAVYCSALRRSLETAGIVAGNAPVISLAELNEQSLGKYEGQILDGSDPERVEEFRRRRRDPDDTLDGGESRNQHLARVCRAHEIMRERHPSGGNILIIGHGGTNNLILQSLLQESTDLTFRFSNTDVYLIELPPNEPAVLWKFVPAGAL